MSRARTTQAIALMAALANFAGCQPKTGEAHPAHAHDEAHGEDGAPAVFKEGQGLRLTPETTEAIGLSTAIAEERELSHTLTLQATVLRSGTPAQATALVAPAVAEELKRHSSRTARIARVDRTAARQAELTLELATEAPAGALVPVAFSSGPRRGLAVPAGALLRSAGGTFLYVKRGSDFQRVPVQAGSVTDGWVEIVEGIRPGEVVAATAVESLWLIELRLTKGGGHSH